MNKRTLIIGSVVLALGIGFTSGWLAHQRESSSAAPTPTGPHPVSAAPAAPHLTHVIVVVPNLEGMPAHDAQAWLKALGLNSRVSSGAVFTGTTHVLGQHPAAGTKVPVGTRVRLYES